MCVHFCVSGRCSSLLLTNLINTATKIDICLEMPEGVRPRMQNFLILELGICNYVWSEIKSLFQESKNH